MKTMTLERLRSRIAAFLHDLLMIPVAWLGAYWLHFDLGVFPAAAMREALLALVLVLPLQALANWHFGLYRGVWRFASLPDLVRIGKAVGAGVLGSTLVLYATGLLFDMPRSLMVLYSLVLLGCLTLPRFFYRWSKDHRLHFRSAQRVLIVNAGKAGDMLVRDMLRDPRQAYRPVAFVDDDRTKHGKEIQGVRVVGPVAAMPRVVQKLAIDLIMLAVPSADAKQMRRLVALAERCGVPFRTIPHLEDLMSGQIGVNELRKVRIEDLLGREPVNLDWPRIREGLTGKVIMITGAGGSIGAELCRQIASLGPAALILLENSEYNLYSIELELREHFSELSLHAHLADITDAVACDRLFARYHPQVVFHAAAYKHVPMLETQVREAVKNNILGTKVVAQAADRYGCSEFVLISTDKAVNPANVMGVTKRVAEIYVQNLNAESETRFITVRFGNVLGSAGSVVPLFEKQIRAGEAVTVTHPQMERYFMTVREACQLIMQASVLGEGGEIFVLNMGKPVNISRLAEEMIRLSGKVPGRDIKIVYSGLRPGEKLHEELFHEREKLMDTSHEQIRLARYREVGWDLLTNRLDEVDKACAAYDTTRLGELLNWFVPERRRFGATHDKAGAVVALVQGE
ncbi:MAG: polysaccharide biosynthesis protein [Chromatiaceae bacterium]|nr:polysaccharide biosynthesis protein [Chromatiaceae bacterium]